MRPSLDLIPARWLDYEPPGCCCIAALPAIGAIGSLVGTGISAIGGMQQAGYEEAVARNQEILNRQKANEDAALGQRAAITESRKTRLAQSALVARAAASGTDATSPSTVDLSQDIVQQGGYNALSALYDGMAKSRADLAQADIDLFNQKRIRSAAPLTAAGTLIGGFGRTAAQVANSPKLLDLFG